jgi:hypothetical protein
MTKIDPDQERARLAARYAAMSDLELQKVGRDPAALTTWGFEALGEEMKKRDLEWKPEQRIAKPIAEDEILIRVGTYPDRNAAGLDRDLLANAGVKGFFCECELWNADQGDDTERPSETQLLVRSRDLIAARHLLMQVHEVPTSLPGEPNEVSTEDRPVILRRYRDMPTAFVEKSVLENAGIQCLLQGDNVVRMDWFWSNAMGGIKLIVRQSDAEDAEKLLAQAPPSEQPPAK